MKLNTKKIAIYIGTKTGKYSYNVCLTEIERDYVANLICKLHNGKIKVFSKKIDSLEWKV